MIVEVPAVELLEEKIDGTVVKEDKSGGRSINGEEFGRILAVVPKVLFPQRKDCRGNPVDQSVVESWRHLLRGL